MLSQYLENTINVFFFGVTYKVFKPLKFSPNSKYKNNLIIIKRGPYLILYQCRKRELY